MISKKELDAMSAYEKSRTDKKRDMKLGEDSPADKRADKKAMLVRGNKNQKPPKGWK